MDFISYQEKDGFLSTFERVVADIYELTESKSDQDIQPSIQDILNYTVPNGKNYRGQLVVAAYKFFSGKDDDESLLPTYVLGWVVEMMHAFALIIDDIMDQSETRRGKKCWYLLEGNIAINDGLLIYESTHQILRKYFEHQPYYMDLVQLLQESAFKATLGQNLDNRTCMKDSLMGFTRERYDKIVTNKTSYYTFCHPVHFGMIVAGRKDLTKNELSLEILKSIGYMFQARDDYLDCYGDPDITGKIGTDIQDGKCTWLVVEALETATEAQRQIIKENYGKKDPACIERVLEIYDELAVQELYDQFELDMYDKLMAKLEKLPEEFPVELYKLVLCGIMSRNK